MPLKVSLNVSCPHCHHRLKDDSKVINQHPGILLNIKTPDKRVSQVSLSSVYGDFQFTCDIPLHEGSIVEFHCPHCGELLNRKNVKCDVCAAPIVSFLCSIGGRVSICSRTGCKNHYLVFDDIDTALIKFYAEYEPF